MFGLMFYDNDKVLWFNEDNDEFYFDTYNEAYNEAERMLNMMYKRGAVKMVIRDVKENVWYEYPILND